MFKNQLQELAQRSCFNLPSYACIREGPDHAPRFKATVNFNGETFDSPSFCNTLRQAEHAAAEVALTALSKRGPSRSLAARVLDETGVYKNLLQETAHRAGLDLPVYTTIRSGPGHTPVFTCTVELAGMNFLGDPAKTKKQAQKNAAMAAWSALKQLPNIGSSSSSLESENKEEQEQVIIARALANMHPANGNRLILNDKKFELKQPPAQQETSAAARAPLYSSPRYQSWLYSNLNPEIGMYQTWNQDQFIHQQSQFLPLPALPPNDPRNFPLIQSIQPMQGQYFPVLEQDPLTSVPFYQESTSNSYLDVTGYPLHATRSRSQVSIQEIREGIGEVEGKERFHNVSSNAEENHREQKPDPLSGAASVSQVEGSNLNFSAVKRSDSEHSQAYNKANDSLHITDMPSEGDSSGGNPSIKPVLVHPHMSGVHGSMHGQKHTQKIQRMARNTFNSPIQSYSNFKTQTHQAFNTTQPAADVGTPPMTSSVLPAHMIGTATGFSIPAYGSGHGADIFRPRTTLMAAPVTMRTAVPVFSARNTTPYLNSCIPRAMAPAVHVRSVAPVCSAPPTHVPLQTKNPENQGASTTASDFSRLHL